MTKILTWIVACFALGLPPARATDVNVVGLFPGKALVEIDRAAPKLLRLGQRVGNVKLIATDANSATLEIDGKRETLRLGQSVSGGGPQVGKRPSVILTADSRGHFVTEGTINGASTRFLVDTGASSIALSSQEARRLGLRYLHGARGMSYTANGAVPTYAVKLDRVQVGGITLHQVDAAVVDGAGLHVTLLGMSFLNRTEMRRQGGTLTLTQQY